LLYSRLSVHFIGEQFPFETDPPEQQQLGFEYN